MMENSPPGLPDVSVVVATHRRPDLLRRTLLSILGQGYPGHIECLVVFDQEDPVAPDVDVPQGREIRLVRNTRTPGPAGAYNEGLLLARGAYVALCNDDDEWLRDKLQLQVAALEAAPDALYAICGIYLGDRRAWARNPARIPDKEVIGLRDLLRLSRNEVHTSTLLFRRDWLLRDVGLVDESIPGSYGEDYDWLLRAARIAPGVAVRQALARVRWQHSYFADRWPVMIQALTYQLEHRPELKQDPVNLARVYGRLAFAQAASGNRGEAREWARRSIRLHWLQPRAYLAYLVSYGLVKPQTILRLAHTVGRGV